MKAFFKKAKTIIGIAVLLLSFFTLLGKFLEDNEDKIKELTGSGKDEENG